MPIRFNLQKNYKLYSANYQIKLPFDMELSVPADDPVRLVNAFVEGMDLSELYDTYDRIRKNQATPGQMLKIMIYAAMECMYSRENMAYDEQRDCYICRDGRELPVKTVRTEKTRTGYSRTVTIYECKSCKKCPYKTKCIRGNNSKTPM